MPEQNHKHLVKFLAASLLFFLAGSIHGVIQLIPPVRAWLDSIGSPNGGPGHLIDPLAHAHINLVGGVMLLVMTVAYYLIPILTDKGIWSKKLMNLEQTLFNWVKAERIGKLKGADSKVVSAEQMEISRLRAELARVKMERDILGKATAYFAKAQS